MDKKPLFVFFNLIVVASFLFLINTAFAQSIVVTQNISVSAVVGSIPSLDQGGGGMTYESGVRFSGLAYPNAVITIQKGFGGTTTVVADASGAFSILVPETSWQLFTLFATDTAGRKSTLLNFPTILYSGYITDITGIRFAPTITTDKLSIKKGDFLTVEGAALPRKVVEVVFEGQGGRTFTLTADDEGVYRMTIPLALPEGEYTLRSRYTGDTRTSKAIRIIVGTASILRNEATTNIPGDCNVDQRVTLVDFSVLAYWYGKENPPRCVDTNQDGIINLVDFSILAFYWNG